MCCPRNKVISIVKGTAFALLGVNDPLAIERKKVCNACEFKNGPLCSKCGCLINSKVRVPGEQCPRKKWLKQ